MRNVCFKKGLVVGIILLFIGVGIQPVYANNVSINNDKIKRYNDLGDSGFSLIFCKAYHFNYILRTHNLAFLVKFELRDLDTGKIIQENFRLIGYNLFTNLKRGNDYEITVISPRGHDTIRVKDISFFNVETLVIVYI